MAAAQARYSGGTSSRLCSRNLFVLERSPDRPGGLVTDQQNTQIQSAWSALWVSILSSHVLVHPPISFLILFLLQSVLSSLLVVVSAEAVVLVRSRRSLGPIAPVAYAGIAAPTAHATAYAAPTVYDAPASREARQAIQTRQTRQIGNKRHTRQTRERSLVCRICRFIEELAQTPIDEAEAYVCNILC